jgi:hypothetical protein
MGASHLERPARKVSTSRTGHPRWRVPMNETNLMNTILLANHGCRLFRNNTGAIKDQTGRLVRFGLCKGSSDLIGFKPVTITPDMVGRTVAIFTAIEVKTPGGKPTPEQLHFVKRVKDHGGIAGIARSVEEMLAITNPLL